MVLPPAPPHRRGPSPRCQPARPPAGWAMLRLRAADRRLGWGAGYRRNRRPKALPMQMVLRPALRADPNQRFSSGFRHMDGGSIPPASISKFLSDKHIRPRARKVRSIVRTACSPRSDCWARIAVRYRFRKPRSSRLDSRFEGRMGCRSVSEREYQGHSPRSETGTNRDGGLLPFAAEDRGVQLGKSIVSAHPHVLTMGYYAFFGPNRGPRVANKPLSTR